MHQPGPLPTQPAGSPEPLTTATRAPSVTPPEPHSPLSPDSPLGPLSNLLLFAILIFVAWLTQQIALEPLLHPSTAYGTLRLTSCLAIEAFNFAALFAITLFMATLEGRSIGHFGFGGRNPLRRFFTGAFWGLAAISILIAAMHALHLLQFDARLDHGPSIFGWALAQLTFFLLVGFFEEYFFRGYLQFTLTRAFANLLTPTHSRTNPLHSPHRARTLAFWIAALITSAFFLYAHSRNPGEDPLGLLLVFFAGAVFVLALWRTGSLWWAIGFHTAWDWSQSFLYGVPDSGGLMQGRLFATHALGKPLYSGGTVGPEGSLLCIPIFLLPILVLLFLTNPSPQPPLEPNL